ncbi:hypothetical protein Tco_0839206 [Tanacetum coccineum]|uniref:Uncharacterized protein n=1 Tax=Tanacetum coccineum TaxID=301880 RepID=A0ABQ5ART9_9ASTR
MTTTYFGHTVPNSGHYRRAVSLLLYWHPRERPEMSMKPYSNRCERNLNALSECTYQDFRYVKPLIPSGTEGLVDSYQWFERMETVFRISNCTVENQVKFCPLVYLMEFALTWKKIKRLRQNMWHLKSKSTDVVPTTNFQELELLCDRSSLNPDKIESKSWESRPDYNKCCAFEAETMRRLLRWRLK